MSFFNYRFLFLLFAVAFLLPATSVSAQEDKQQWALVPVADGFDFPVGKPNGEGFYKARGLRFKSPRHLGEDWNSNGGGDSDVGAPTYSVAHGLVTYAADAKGAWGKVVIVRHAFREPSLGKMLCCQTLYAHLDRVDVKVGQIVKRGDKVGTIGTGNGRYPAHLHFELHFNIDVNCGQQGIPKTPRNYGDPSAFINRYRRLTFENRKAKVPVGGFLPYKGTDGL